MNPACGFTPLSVFFATKHLFDLCFLHLSQLPITFCGLLAGKARYSQPQWPVFPPLGHWPYQTGA